MPGKSRALQAAEEANAQDGLAPVLQYSRQLDTRAHDLALLAYTNDEIAISFGVDVSTINRWISEKPSFKRALARGRELADSRVARSLYKRAVGMTVRKQKAFNVNGTLQTIDIVEGVVPDVNAAALWLSNRQRGKWRAANAGAENGPTFDLGSFVQAIGQAVAQAQSRPGDDAKPVDLLDTVSSEPNKDRSATD